jgi:hypothetical protein
MLIPRPLYKKKVLSFMWRDNKAESTYYNSKGDPHKARPSKHLVVRALNHGLNRVRTTRGQLQHRHTLPAVIIVVEGDEWVDLGQPTSSCAPFGRRSVGLLRDAAAGRRDELGLGVGREDCISEGGVLGTI